MSSPANGAADLIQSWNKNGWFTCRSRGRQDRAPDRRRARQGGGHRQHLDQPLQGALAALNLAPQDAPAAQAHRERTQQLPDRPLHRRGPVQGARLRAGAGRARRDRRRAHRRGGRADAHPCELPHRRHARHGRRDRRRPRGRRADACGTWRTAPARCRWTCTRRRRRLRGRLRLQIPQRRPGRAGLRLGQPDAHRPLLAAAGRLVGPRHPVRLHTRLPARARHHPLPVRHPTHHQPGRARLRRWTRVLAAEAAGRHGRAAQASRSR